MNKILAAWAWNGPVSEPIAYGEGQINQTYAYIQLPLHLRQGEHKTGELFVYTNKKNLAGRDGRVSALLHLDMEHLGP